MLPKLTLSRRALALSVCLALLAMLALAFGIGATTAIFSALRVARFRRAPSAPERWMHIWSGEGGRLSPAAYLNPKAQVKH